LLANINRPHTLDKVIGQDIVVKAINNGFKNSTLGNVIYLIGNSGTGKNTLANIIAETLVCENPSVDEKGYKIPCCKCKSCIDIIEERWNKIKVYPGANLNAEALKSIEDELQYLPLLDEYRIYIFNEAQQSPVLRRLLEIIEPIYKNTTFIITSTDKSKFSNQSGKSNKEQETQALRSRGTYFNLKPISSKQIGNYLFSLLVENDPDSKIPESFMVEVIPTISDNAQGNFRTAINDFNTVLNAEVYTEKETIELLGYTNTKEYNQILIEICNRNSIVLQRIKELDDIYGFCQYINKVLTDIQIRYILGKSFDEEWKEKNYNVIINTKYFKDVYKMFMEINQEASGLYNGTFTNYFIFRLLMFFDPVPIMGLPAKKPLEKKPLKKE
jgi:DNA polymerase III gamma/tau subunit